MCIYASWVKVAKASHASAPISAAWNKPSLLARSILGRINECCDPLCFISSRIWKLTNTLKWFCNMFFSRSIWSTIWSARYMSLSENGGTNSDSVTPHDSAFDPWLSKLVPKSQKLKTAVNRDFATIKQLFIPILKNTWELYACNTQHMHYKMVLKYAACCGLTRSPLRSPLAAVEIYIYVWMYGAHQWCECWFINHNKTPMKTSSLYLPYTIV